MKKIIIIIIAAAFLIGCGEIVGSAEDSEKNYRNEKFVIVNTNESPGLTDDKFRSPVLVKKWLIRSVSDTTMFAELSSYNGINNGWSITNEMWYNHKIGDTLFFKWLRKDRFFKIQNSKHEN